MITDKGKEVLQLLTEIVDRLEFHRNNKVFPYTEKYANFRDELLFQIGVLTVEANK